MLELLRSFGLSQRRRPRHLSSDQVRFFHRTGFLALPELTTADDVARIRSILMALYARFPELPRSQVRDLGDHHGAEQIPEINWAIRLAPALRRTLAFVRCQAIAQELLGCPVVYTGFDHAILKPPRNGRATPWHQDEVYSVDRGPWAAVHFWIALQDVTVDMGCMQFIPGSHVGALRPHRRIRATAHARQADDVDVSAAVACPVPEGGATVHLPRTLHYTGPNLTDRPRLAWGLHFGPPELWRPSFWSRNFGRTNRWGLGSRPAVET